MTLYGGELNHSRRIPHTDSISALSEGGGIFSAEHAAKPPRNYEYNFSETQDVLAMRVVEGKATLADDWHHADKVNSPTQLSLRLPGQAGHQAAGKVIQRKKKKKRFVEQQHAEEQMSQSLVQTMHERADPNDVGLSLRPTAPGSPSFRSDRLGTDTGQATMRIYSDPKQLERLSKPIPYKTYNYDPTSDVNNYNSNSNRATVTGYSDPQRVEKLSKPTADRFEKQPEPPRYCVDYPLLPFDRVDHLQQLTNKIAVLNTDLIESLRFTVTASVSKSWKESTNLPNRSFTQRRSNFMEKKPQTHSLDLKKIQSKLSDKMIGTRELANYQYSEFSKKLSIGYVVVVLDMHMQLMGTFDCAVGVFIPGLVMTPAFLTKKIAKSKLSFNRANLMEIDFNKLPPESFAVVPVFMDESYIHPQHKHTLPTRPSVTENGHTVDPTSIELTCDLFLKSRDPSHQYLQPCSSSSQDPSIHSELSKEEAERFLPQDYLMAQCDGVEDLWFKIAQRVRSCSSASVRFCVISSS
jgi:hypothetical protein